MASNASDPIGCGCSEYPECTHVLYFYMGVKHAGTLNAAHDSTLMASNESVVAELRRRITDYLSLGGLFNPELAHHDKLRDLLIDCRDALEPLIAQLEAPASAPQTGEVK